MKRRKPKEGQTIYLQDKNGNKIPFMVHWIDKDTILLSNFMHFIPCTWKELSEIMENDKIQR